MRFERRLDQPRWLAVAVPVGSIAVGFALMAVVLVSTGHAPGPTYRRLFDSAFFADGALSATLVSCTPLLFTGLAAAAAFRMRLYNIGGEGQFFWGAIAGVGIALYLGDRGLDSTPVYIAATAVVGAAAGAAWAAIPGAPAGVRPHQRDHHLADAELRRRARPHLPDHRQPVVLARPRVVRGSDLSARQDDPRSDGPPRRWTRSAGSLVPLGFGIAVALAAVMSVVLRTDSVRLRAAGDRGLAAEREVRRHAASPEDRGRDVPLGRPRRARRRELRSGLRLPARSSRDCRRRSTAIRGSSSRHSPATTRSRWCRSPSCSAALVNAGFTLQGADFPSGLVGVMQGLYPLLCARRRRAAPLPASASAGRPRGVDPQAEAAA